MNLSPLPDHPTISVVIPARNAAATLPAAIASALDQDAPGPLDVWVAAGDPASRAAAEAVGDPRVHVVDNPIGTAPAGLNLAIGASGGQVVVRLDAHAELPPGYVATAIAVMRETNAANVGGRQIPVAPAGMPKAIAIAMASPLGSGGARYRVGGPPGDVETVYLGVFRREALEEVGLFDETLVRNQDYELNHRLREAGGRVYFHPDLGVRYAPRPTLGRLWSQYVQYGAWKRTVLRRHPGSVKVRQLIAPAFVLAVVAGLLLAVITGWWWPLAALIAVYLAALTADALRHAPPALVPGVVAALTTMHVAWGLGFLVGRSGRDGRSGRATMGPRALDG